MDQKTDHAQAPALELSGLQTGDILLMLGEGPLSDLIAWASDGPYSHAAVVADNGELIEASTVGVRRYCLAQRVADQAHYHYIDAFRPHAPDGAPLADADLSLVLAKAQSLLGIPYPVDQLALLGAIMALRGKWPVHTLARLVVREALDHVLSYSSDRMVCSEVVYRAFAESAATPAGRLAPPIVVGQYQPTPFPNIDWQALYDELAPLLRPASQARLQALPVQAAAVDAPQLLGAGVDAPGVEDEELEQARQAVLVALSPQQGGAGLLQAGPEGIDPAPNPRLVSPQDLAVSPGVSLLGRLMQRTSG